ncbi:MAG: SMP-30/gluconolactonase/LRE family protein [Pseudomonadota bacterium]
MNSNKMRGLRRIPVGGSGPEDVVFEPSGHVLTGLRDEGRLVRVDPASGEVSKVAELGGMPLGLEWMPDGRLLVCNAKLGPQLVDVTSGDVKPLPVKGIQVHLANNAHALPDGTVFLSDSSSAYPLEEYQKDIVEDTASGRLLRIDPDGQGHVLKDGLSFANGVVVLEDQGLVLVAETAKCRIHAVPLAGGAARVWAKTPGHPDNLALDADGQVWAAMPSLESATLAKLHASPLFLRKIAIRLPEALQPKPELCCRITQFGPDGTLRNIFDGDTDVYSFATSMRRGPGVMAMGSIEHDAIGLFEA